MAPSSSSSEETPPVSSTPPRKGQTRSRRQCTLAGIKALLIILCISAVVCVGVQAWVGYREGSSTDLAGFLMPFASSLSLAYIILHNITSFKMLTWKHHRGKQLREQRAASFVVRYAALLCATWLVTVGWNMILVARRPVCLPDEYGDRSWEVGTTCVVGRVGIVASVVALMASCALFGMMASVSRPFEAHLLGSVPGRGWKGVLGGSRRGAPLHGSSVVSGRRYRRCVSLSTHRSKPSTELGPIDPMPTSTTMFLPSARSLDLEVLTSTTNRSQPPLFNPSLSKPTPHLPIPPRLPPVFLPPAQFAPSAWRAVHPSPYGSSPMASRNGSLVGLQGSQYRTRYSRSSISLTRPHRLSVAIPLGSASVTTSERSASPDKVLRLGEEVVAGGYGDVKGISLAATGEKGVHARHVSAPEGNVEGKWERRSDRDRSQKRECTDGRRGSSFELETRRSDRGQAGGGQVYCMRKVRSDDLIRPPVPAKAVGRAATTRVLHSEEAGRKTDRGIGTTLERERRLTFDDLKNKPLPRIAAL